MRGDNLGRVGIFRENIPAEGVPSSPEYLAQILTGGGYDVSFLNAGELANPDILKVEDFDLLVLPYGGSYPVEAVVSLRQYLKRGGNFISMGGYAFNNPLSHKGGKWREESEIRINTSSGKPGDFLKIEPEQIGVFDAGYPLKGVVSARPDPTQAVVDHQLQLAEPLSGYSAVGVVGPGDIGTGQCRARLIPLLIGYDRWGRKRGIIGSILHNYAGLYKGSSWSFFGVTNQDLFSEQRPRMATLFLQVAEHLIRSLWLEELRSRFACYYPGEEIQILAKANNFGTEPRQAQFRVSISLLDNPTPLFSQQQQLLLDPGQSQQLSFSFSSSELNNGFYRTEGALYLDKKAVDREQNGFILWDRKPLADAPELSYRDNYLEWNGRPTFLLATQEFYHWNGKASCSPLDLYRDFSAMRDYGVRLARVFTRFSDTIAPVSTEEDVRLNDALVWLSAHHGVAFMFTPHLWCTAGSRKLAAEREIISKLSSRYQRLPHLLIDLMNEPLLPQDEDTKEAFNDWLKCRYVSIEKLGQAWQDDPAQGDFGHIDLKPLRTDKWDDLRTFDTYSFTVEKMREWAKSNYQAAKEGDQERLVTCGFLHACWDREATIASSDLDFTNRHFYGDIRNFATEFAVMDMRYQGKAPSVGEFGSKTHPAGGWNFETPEDQLTRYLHICHYTLGLGGVFAANWHWRDPWETIFPYGILHQDWVPKDILYPYRAMALFFERLRLKYVPPQLYYLIPDCHRLGGANLKVYWGFSNGLQRLMGCGVNFGCINEYNLDRLPSEARAMIYPIPYTLEDSTYHRLCDFVENGGTLFISGDISYDPSRKRTRTSRLESLCGVTFEGERYPNITYSSEHAKRIRPLCSEFVEYTGYPGIRIRPQTAEVIAETTEGEPVAVLNRFGQGKVFYTTDPIELHLPHTAVEVYQAFLDYAGLTRFAVRPREPFFQNFKLATTEAESLFLFCRGEEGEDLLKATLEETGRTVTLMVRKKRQGVVLLGEGVKINAVETQGPVSLDEEIILDTNAHILLYSLDKKEIIRSEALVLFPLSEGRFQFNSQHCWDEPVVEAGEIKQGRWKTFEQISPILSGGKLSFDIREEHISAIILISEKHFLPRARQRIAR